jgi:hypothetical protein
VTLHPPKRSAKEITVKPIEKRVADRFMIATHYSGRVVKNSQLHFGVFMDKRLEGVVQLGPSMDKRKVAGLVRDTPWDGFLEINRLAFTDYLPRNSESRALGIVLRMIRRRYPAVKWIVTYADACQCGDGTIYRAAGFVLTDIKKNYNVRRDHDGKARVLSGRWDYSETEPLPGFQLRYIFFIDPSWRERLTVEAVPFSEIAKAGASMARGFKTGGVIQAGASGEELGVQPSQDGSKPIPPLQSIPLPLHTPLGVTVAEMLAGIEESDAKGEPDFDSGHTGGY